MFGHLMQHIKLLLQDLLVLQLPTVDSAPEVGVVVEASTTADISSPKDEGGMWRFEVAVRSKFMYV